MARWREILHGAFGRGAFPHELWFLLEIPGRRWIQPPREIADHLHLRADSRVLELGPGSGFFTVEVAPRLNAGRLTLLDLQPAMLRRVRRRLAKRRADTRLGCAAGDAGRLPFADLSFDVAFMVAVLGEVPDPAACLRELRRVVAPNGILSISEHQPDPDFIAFDDLVALAADAGWRLAEAWRGRLGYTANFG